MIDLGTIAAHVNLDLAGLVKGVGQAQAAMLGLERSIGGHSASVAAHAARMSTAFVTAGGAIGVGLAVATKKAVDWEQTLAHIGGNTTLTSAQLKQLGENAKKMAAQTGAAAEDVANAYMHATNLSFSFADSQKIVEAANKSALSSGAKTADVARTLAQVLREGGLSAKFAAPMMDALHVASANSTVKLEEFAHSGAKAFGMAGNLGVSMTNVGAVMAVLTKHGFPSASLAATQMTGMLSKIINPAAMTQKYIAELSRTSGVDLVRDFSAAGLAAKGLPAVIDDISRATHGNATEILKLIPAQRGGMGMLALVKTGHKDLIDTLHKTSHALGATEVAFEREQKTAKAAADRLHESLNVLAINAGTVLLPALKSVVTSVNELVGKFNALPKPVQEATVKFAAGAAAVLLVAGGIARVISVAATLAPLFVRLASVAGTVWRVFTTVVFACQAVAGGAATVAEGFGIVVAAMGGPVTLTIAAVVALMAGLAYAWTHDIGHIREVTHAGIAWITQFLHGSVQGWVWVWNNGWSAIRSAFSSMLSHLIAMVQGWGRSLVAAGHNAVAGFANGIRTGVGHAVSAAKSMAESAVASVQSALQIHSPSVVFYEIGRYVAQGMAGGIRSGTGLVTEAVQQMAGRAADEARRAAALRDRARQYSDRAAALHGEAQDLPTGKAYNGERRSLEHQARAAQAHARALEEAAHKLSESATALRAAARGRAGHNSRAIHYDVTAAAVAAAQETMRLTEAVHRSVAGRPALSGSSASDMKADRASQIETRETEIDRQRAELAVLVAKVGDARAHGDKETLDMLLPQLRQQAATLKAAQESLAAFRRAANEQIRVQTALEVHLKRTATEAEKAAKRVTKAAVDSAAVVAAQQLVNQTAALQKSADGRPVLHGATVREMREEKTQRVNELEDEVLTQRNQIRVLLAQVRLAQAQGDLALQKELETQLVEAQSQLKGSIDAMEQFRRSASAEIQKAVDLAHQKAADERAQAKLEKVFHQHGKRLPHAMRDGILTGIPVLDDVLSYLATHMDQQLKTLLEKVFGKDGGGLIEQIVTLMTGGASGSGGGPLGSLGDAGIGGLVKSLVGGSGSGGLGAGLGRSVAGSNHGAAYGALDSLINGLPGQDPDTAALKALYPIIRQGAWEGGQWLRRQTGLGKNDRWHTNVHSDAGVTINVDAIHMAGDGEHDARVQSERLGWMIREQQRVRA